MLARENRLRSAEDFRSTMKAGRKATSEHLVIYLNSGSSLEPARFGFVVARTVGSAVKRNLVKRRARAAIRERLGSFAAGQVLVVRALPGLAELTWLEFCNELDDCLKQNKIS